MNSFKAVYQAMDYEAKRQRQAVAEGRKLTQETRGWVEAKGKTVSQRSKEYAHDYRYFPEPDLPPLAISREWVEEIKARLPELPEDRRDRFITEYGLSLYDANLLTGSKGMADYFEESTKTEDYKKLPPNKAAKEVSNWLLGEASRIMNANSIDIDEFRKTVGSEQLLRLILSSHNVINVAMAKTVLEEMFQTGKDADEIITRQGLSQISDTQVIAAATTKVVNSNVQAVADFRSGKEAALKFLVGQVMKATRGRANPALVNEVLKKKLAEGANTVEER
jgi:aspartyl-tRNA(Asn)/glutamyl-tRNA(Gln) amidotransferase subunit B